jgi:hypothetical protein
LYAYLIVRHPASYSAYTNNLSISFIQVIWPTAHDTTNFLCEDSYVDSNVRYGLTLNGVHQPRNGLQPNFYDNWHTAAVPGMPPGILQYTTGVFTGSTNGKYSFTFDYGLRRLRVLARQKIQTPIAPNVHRKMILARRSSPTGQPEINCVAADVSPLHPNTARKIMSRFTSAATN